MTDLREKAYKAFNDAFSALEDGWLDGAVGRRHKAGVDAVLALARPAIIEDCAKVADEHLAIIRDHNPDRPMKDLVAQGYGNASLNIAHSLRAMAKKP